MNPLHVETYAARIEIRLPPRLCVDDEAIKAAVVQQQCLRCRDMPYFQALRCHYSQCFFEDPCSFPYAAFAIVSASVEY